MTVTCVNDEPSASAQGPLVFLEDSSPNPITLTGSAGPANESGQTLTFYLDSLPANGTLSETSGGPSAAVDAALSDASLFFTPNASYCTTGNSFAFYVKDDGGVANGGDDTSSNAIVSVTVTCVNDAPAGTDKTVTTLEDTTYTFTAADFGFTDPSDSPANASAG